MTATKNVPAKQKTTEIAVANYEERLAALAKEGAEQESRVMGGSFISFKNGMISYQGDTIRGNELDVIVLDHVFENQYNPERYDPDNPQPPVCYAFGRNEDELAPHPESAEPQHETCKGCPHNEFGTADNGRGKACKNTRRLAVLPGDALDVETLQTAEAAFIRLPVTSVKGWSSFVKSIAALDKLPTFGVVATMSTLPDPKTQFKVVWKKKATIDRELLPVLLERHEAMREEILFPYPKPSEDAAKKPVTKKGRGKF